MPFEKPQAEEEIQNLIGWYQNKKRDLPWRRDNDGYHVWISEIMLQQTRIETVIPYYERFMKRLPSIPALAGVEDDVLLKLWEGLGYYSRARNLKKAAAEILDRYGGEMPSSYEEILSLPGIGPYTAGAIASIAFSVPVPAVDGNVMRVVSRAEGSFLDIAQETSKKTVTSFLAQSMPKDIPGIFNSALMELGETVCIPHGEPLCKECPLQYGCVAFKEKLTGVIPVKKKAKQRRIEHKTVFLIFDDDSVMIRKRGDTGLLAGLYEFPNTDGWPEEENKGLPEDSFSETEENGVVETMPGPEAVHIFSHVEWQMKSVLVRVKSLKSTKGLHARREELDAVYAIPGAFRVYTEEIKKLLKK